MILRTLALLAALGVPAVAQAADRECAQSPGKVIEVCVWVEGGQALYEVTRKGVTVLAPSALGLRFAGEDAARYTALTAARRSASDTSWEQPWGEQRIIRDNHSELTVSLAGDTPLNRSVDVTFRLFDDGIGFRYGYNAIPAGQAVSVTGDRTEFHTVGAYQAWWYQGLGQERDEYLYTQTDARRITLAETPLTLKGENGLYLSFHEAALVDFPSMLLAGNGTGTLTAWLMPWPDGVRARKTGPFTTPWRTVLIGDSAGALADSRIELNLNEPSKIADISWFKPGKYVGVWWEMHLNKSTWGSGRTHGANTANVERYMDFAAKYGFDGVLVEGWNQGWDGDWIANGDKFSFTKPYPDFDLRAITAYGKAKGVKLIGHHETGGAVVNYEAQLEDAMKLYESVGVSSVKTGYVRHSGDIIDQDGGHQWFAGQYMVRHNLRVAEVAAAHRIAIDAHEPVKDTGLRRTWPNMVSREGARGQEFNAWGDTDQPARACRHPALHPHARRADGLYARHLRPGARQGRCDQARPIDPGDATRALRRALQPDPDGRRPAGKLRGASRRLPVHPRRADRLGDLPDAGRRDRRLYRRRPPAARRQGLVPGRADRRECPQAHAAAHLPDARQALRGADLPRRAGRRLSDQPDRARDRAAGGDQQGQPGVRHGARGRRGDPLQDPRLTRRSTGLQRQ